MVVLDDWDLDEKHLVSDYSCNKAIYDAQFLLPELVMLNIIFSVVI